MSDVKTDEMTLRDYFAGQVLGNMAIGNRDLDADWFEKVGAAHAYRIADAMIKTRETPHD